MDGTDAGDGTGGQDDWYPQLEEAAPPIRSRRRLPRDLAAAIDSGPGTASIGAIDGGAKGARSGFGAIPSMIERRT
ncbi:hypothetical protein [Streptomyces sp. NPDC057909]|uniref:hypothetical protein n=1 Tax=Streptomyces sp. NPDC057909 TaxID=3346277 RepID=UPI0036E8926C